MPESKRSGRAPQHVRSRFPAPRPTSRTPWHGTNSTLQAHSLEFFFFLPLPLPLPFFFFSLASSCATTTPPSSSSEPPPTSIATAPGDTFWQATAPLPLPLPAASFNARSGTATTRWPSPRERSVSHIRRSCPSVSWL